MVTIERVNVRAKQRALTEILARLPRWRPADRSDACTPRGDAAVVQATRQARRAPVSTLKWIFSVIALTIATASTAQFAQAASYGTRPFGCKGMICLNASFAESTLRVSYSFDGSNANSVTHFNVRSSCFGGQLDVEPGKVVTIGVPEGRTSCSVSTQWCMRGPIGLRSICGQWQQWNVDTPQNDVKVITKCRDAFCMRARVDGHFVQFKLTKFPLSTHRNIRSPSGQTEGSAVNFRFAGTSTSVLVQSCNRGGFLERS